MKKIFFIIIFTIFLIGSVEASTIANINPSGELSFLKPNMQEVLNTVMCASGPLGAVTCIEQYVQGKIIGFVSGKIMEQISKASPEIYKAITTYNQIKGYVDKGSSILKEIEINEKGKIEKGSISFNEEEYSINDLFTNSSAEDILVSNADYDFETKKLEIKENGFLKIKTKDKEGKIQERTYENIKEGYFKMNESGAIDEAKFISSNKSTYQFGNYEPIKVGADTQVEYENGKLTVYGKDKNFLYGDLNVSLIGDYIDFTGNKIQCLECQVGEISLKGFGLGLTGGIGPVEGILERTTDGYIIDRGYATYKQNVLKVSYENDRILIANLDADLSDYNGNWLRQTSNALEVKSYKEGFIDLENLENHDVLNTDKKDKLNFQIKEGDGLKIEKRTEEGLIPKVIHKSYETGETKISNDKIDLILNSKSMSLISSGPLSVKELEGKYQSVAFDIQSDSLKMNTKLRINSYSQFVVLGDDSSELVTYNKYDLPVSALIEDNSLQTIEQLRKKYPNMKFEVPFSTPVGIFGTEEVNELSEENLPPYLLYITDEFLKTNPDPEALNKIEFDNVYNAQAQTEEPTIIIGRKVVDPSQEGGEIRIRDITSPIQVIRHEYEHRMDMTIQDKEFEVIGSLGDLQIKSAVEEVNSIEEEINQLNNLEITTPEELKAWNKAMSYQEAQLRKAREKVMKEYYNAMPEKRGKTLLQSYNELAMKGIKDLVEGSGFKEQLAELSNSIEGNYIRPELDNLVQEIYHKDIITYIKEELKYESNEKVLEAYEKDMNNLHAFVISKLNSLDKNDLTPDVRDKIYTIDNLNEEIRNLAKGEDKLYFNNVKLLYAYLSGRNELDKERKQIDSLIRINSGIPYLYSLRSYGGSGDVATSFYMELPTTYREQPIETRKALVQSSNKAISDMFKKLTQLAFDSGKMDASEFQEIMGKGFCKRGDCSDKICIEYKFLCCENNPISPNCSP
ncbi:MAG: hypothetical protein Q7S06_02915 [Nanoarchaeota archaeon]|nr:hypothetical protein [Nanoarchaeota archaeon]